MTDSTDSIVKRLFFRLWDSPTFTTWASFVSRPLNLILLTPLIVTKLTVAESGVWFLFSTYLGLQSLANLGIYTTIIRTYAYALGGAKEIKVFYDKNRIESDGKPNWELIEEITSTLNYLFSALAVFYCLVLLTIGSISLQIPIGRVALQGQAWISWSIIIVISGVNIYGNLFGVYVQGLNKVALYMRWRTLFSIFSIVTSSIALYLSSNLMVLVIVYQFWILLNNVRDYFLARSIYEKKLLTFQWRGFNKKVFKGVFPSAWRTWLAQFMSFGLIQISGILYAQIGSAHAVATYLFSLKIMDLIKSFSNAPFYSKIPSLARLFAENKMVHVVKNAQKGMLFSHLTFVASFIFLGIFMPIFLTVIHSKVVFADPALWLYLGLAYWLERYGAMHFQLYGLTNHIVAHIGNGVTGAIYVFLSALLLKPLGVVAFPISYIIGCLLFYTWYGARYSYRYFELTFLKFESRASLPAVVILLLYSLVVFCYMH